MASHALSAAEVLEMLDDVHEVDLEDPFEEPICQGSNDDLEPEDGEEESDDLDIISRYTCKNICYKLQIMYYTTLQQSVVQLLKNRMQRVTI